MMNDLIKKLMLSFVVFLPIAAVGEQKSETPQSEAGRIRQVSGEIIQMKKVEVRGTDTSNTVVMLKTKQNDRRLVVDLGPSTEASNKKLAVGKNVKVEGQVVQLRGQPVLVASRASLGNQAFDIKRTAQEQQASKPKSNGTQKAPSE